MYNSVLVPILKVLTFISKSSLSMRNQRIFLHFVSRTFIRTLVVWYDVIKSDLPFFLVKDIQYECYVGIKIRRDMRVRSSLYASEASRSDFFPDLIFFHRVARSTIKIGG